MVSLPNLLRGKRKTPVVISVGAGHDPPEIKNPAVAAGRDLTPPKRGFVVVAMYQDVHLALLWQKGII